MLVSRFPFLGRLRLKNIHTKVYKYQRDLADFIKKRRTVKLLHLLRNYSALVVVISSAILVAATNVAASKGSGGFLFGSGSGDEEQLIAVSKKIDAQSSRKSNLALVPLAKSGIAVDPDAKDDFESEAINPIQGQVMMVSVNTSLRDPEEEGGVEIYTVRTGDTVSAIAARNSITVNTILWANDIDNVDSIMPGDKIFILPVAGVGHTVKSGDTLDSIAKKYKADKEKIITFNGLPADGTIREGDEIIIPGGQKEVPQSPGTASGLLRQYATPLGGTPLISGWRKLDGRAGAGHRFPYGYCTWYVSQRRFIPWGGNAGAWLYNAKAGGYQTSKAPRVGAIIVTAESWWGHVGIVEKVSGGSVTISEMNYNRWGKVNKRTLATSSRVIKGYIY
ncbi:MAG: LysM peptidoglycan-binding domain-containing protein [Candidatus Moranbacteria bacterium]|nr:LysM peptidoglycan-binding domain-containing protein [Candidatus Moranbacteria bacterium]